LVAYTPAANAIKKEEITATIPSSKNVAHIMPRIIDTGVTIE
jgi:hypothetical protein